MFDSLFFATALAQAASEAPKGPSTFEMLGMPVGFLLIMYFLIMRPQQKKAKEHATLISGLKPGDEVVTTGGIIGKVRSVAEGFVTVEVAPNTNLKIIKTHVAGLTKSLDAPATGAALAAKAKS